MSALSRLTLLAAIALFASAAHAVGLGPVELRSYLNEPLRADIALRDVPADRLERLGASIASERAYEELGLARNDYLRNVSATLAMEDGKPVVRLRGQRPLQEPLLEVLVVVREGRQMVQRSYTLLIDPPQFAPQPQQPGPAPAPTPAPAPASPQPLPTEAGETSPQSATAPAEAAPAERASVVDAVESAPDAASERMAAMEVARTASPPAEGAPESTATQTASPDRSEPPMAEKAATEATDTEAVEDQQAAPAAGRSPREEAPTFFTTESERKLDPELLAEIGQGPAATETNRSSAGASVSPRPTAGVYPVRRGETLWRVASNTRPPGSGISMQQMMLAIIENNPTAFENGDARQLRAGARLRIPDATSIRAIDQARALRQMKAMLEGGQSIGAVSTAPVQTADASDSDAVAATEAATEEAGAAAASPDVLGTDGEASESAVAETEDDAGRTPARKEAGAGDAAQGEDPEESPLAAEAADDTRNVVAAEEGTGGAADANGAMVQGDVSPDAVAAAGPGAGEARDATASSQSSEEPKAEAPDRQAAAGPQEATAPEQAPAVTEAERSATASSPPAIAPATWLGLPWYLLLVAAGVVLLGAAAIIEMRRRGARRAAAQAEDEPTTVSLTAASTAPAPLATNSHDEGASEAESAEATQVSEPGDDALGEAGGAEDPLADADFRIAYGMYDDAAERLTDAISRDPENAALRVKLAEVYCAAGDRERFLDAADAAARSGLSADEERELAEMAGRIAPDSRFATAIGASMAAGAMLGQDEGEAAIDPAGPDTGEDLEVAAVAETSFDDAFEAPDRSDSADSDSRVDEIAEAAADPGADLDGLLDDQDAATGTPTEVPEPTGKGADAATEHESADNVLEFDLEGLEFGDAPAPSASTGAEPADPTAGSSDHALDFDLDSLDLSEDAPASPPLTASAEEASPVDENALDFDWELPEEDDTASEPPVSAADVSGMGPDAFDAANNAIDTDASTEATVSPSTDLPLDGDPLAVSNSDADGFDLDDFSLEDFDVDGSGEPATDAAQSDAGQGVPMLELPAEEPPSSSATGEEDAFALDDFEIDPGAGPTNGDGGGDQGVAGQLDLARAYVDMGEGDMARPLLETVVQGGDATQRAEAQRLLDIVG
ncbi:FimV/HubP family polar landmark protein [Algiphilus sp.]|uniref:FimV/HubP family polar landmark protein n=1 Tax=Algiphilus sp. TaxID=1872431 RepID=UPI003B52B86A